MKLFLLKQTLRILFVFTLFATMMVSGAQAKVSVYKLFDKTSLSPSPRLQSVQWSGVIPMTLPYDFVPGTQVFLAGDETGSDPANVRDIFELQVRKVGIAGSGERYIYDARGADPWLCTDMRDLYPREVTNLFQLPLSPDESAQWEVQAWMRVRCQADPYEFGPVYLIAVQPEPGEEVPTPTPMPAGVPAPFLKLPWDYHHMVGNSRMTFSQASQSLNSIFDHQYPILGLSNLSEPGEFSNTAVSYSGMIYKDYIDEVGYSRHDGLDWGTPAGVNHLEPVWAAAGGIARYRSDCADCGNMILIDHKNGYQTRYMHLSSKDIILNKASNSIPVRQGDMIGRTGYTGNVQPAGAQGAHIHFMVVQDKDNDGDFDDNIPDGVTDPFGWRAGTPDPWPNYTFTQNGETKSGNQSHYLWLDDLDSARATKTPAEVIRLAALSFVLNLPANLTDQTIDVTVESAPATQWKTLHTVGGIISATAKDLLGEVVQFFQNVFTIEYDFSAYPIDGYDRSSFAIYSSSDNGLTWQREDTTIDWDRKVATAQVGHMTLFALMAVEEGEVAPETDPPPVAPPTPSPTPTVMPTPTSTPTPTPEPTAVPTPTSTPAPPPQSKTYPELRAWYDVNARVFKYEADNGSVVSVKRRKRSWKWWKKSRSLEVQLESADGVKTKVRLEEDVRGRTSNLSVRSVTYGDKTVKLGRNTWKVVMGKKRKGKRAYIQTASLSKLRYSIAYSSRKNRSTFITKPKKQKRTVERLLGVQTLKLTMEDGKVQYSLK